MATKETWSTRIRHDSDAEYQFWRDELITKLGLMVAAGNLAADETNITAAAGARPGLGAEQGYAVYHLNDSLHATVPIYIRFGFGTSSAATVHPALTVTVGTSTNGSGVLGGTALSALTRANGSSTQTSTTVRNSYLCCLPGFLGLNHKQGAAQTEALFVVARTVDSSGAITSTGCIAVWGSGQQATLSKTQAFGLATPVAYTAQTTVVGCALGFSPQVVTSTIVGSNTQAFVAWIPTPAMAPIVGVCGVLDAEQATGNTFSATMVGSTSRTYMSLSTVAGPFGPLTTATAGALKYAMLWE